MIWIQILMLFETTISNTRNVQVAANVCPISLIAAKQVKTLKISSTCLTIYIQAKLTIPTSIPDHILHLDMNNNDIQKIEYDVCRNYKTLRELKVDDNKIVEIENNAFRNCGKLTILTMRNNRLATLPQNTVSH